MEIVNAYTGVAHTANAKDFDSLRHALSRSEGIAPENMFLLVAPSGHQLRSTDARRVFVYDKLWPHAKPPKQEHNDARNDVSDGDVSDGDVSGGNVGDGNGVSDNLSDSNVSDNASNVSDNASNAGDTQEGSYELCLEAAGLVVKNLVHNIGAITKILEKQRRARADLEADVTACSNWRRYYTALQQIPQLNAELPELLAVDAIEHSYSELVRLWNHIVGELDRLGGVDDELHAQAAALGPGDASTLATAQAALLKVLRRVGQVQLRAMNELRKPLAAVGTDLKRLDALKLEVAQVIDLPFLYGVLLIEHARRTKWRHDFGPIWQREADRRREWHAHYGHGTVGSVIARLDRVSELRILESSDSMQDMLPTDPGSAAESSDVTVYLGLLESLQLDEVHRDLLTELGAMKRQLARSMSASISLLAPDLSGTALLSRTPSTTASSPWAGGPGSGPGLAPSTAPPAGSSTVAAYEARIRKLETMLMTRLSTKTHELDIIRAETRAEARAEARAEVKAEQQDARIAELERQNAELGARLQSYTLGLETALNSMGLQTSRSQADTGPGTYEVNRVKGLSRRAGPAAEDDNLEVAPTVSQSQTPSTPSGATGSASRPSSTSDSHSTTASQGSTAGSGLHSSRETRAYTPSSHTNESQPAARVVPFDKLLETTYVDNQVLFEAVSKRFGDVERLARKLQLENRKLKDRDARMERDLRQRVVLHSFRAEDLILFLPTRDPRRQPNPWAAFNAGAPHYFLHPKHAQQLKNREYLIARASSIERHVTTTDADNPFQLPNGVEWFLISIHGEWGV